jgi:hypothetical protein
LCGNTLHKAFLMRFLRIENRFVNALLVRDALKKSFLIITIV